MREAENKRLDNEVNLERLAETQLERDYMQQTMWKKNLLKLQGKLRGSPWDPLPGEDIPFSSFSQLLEQNRVQYMDYGEFGRHVAGKTLLYSVITHVISSKFHFASVAFASYLDISCH